MLNRLLFLLLVVCCSSLLFADCGVRATPVPQCPDGVGCADFSNACTDPASPSHFCDVLRGRDCLCSDGTVVRITEGHQGTGGGECGFGPVAWKNTPGPLQFVDHEILKQISKLAKDMNREPSLRHS